MGNNAGGGGGGFGGQGGAGGAEPGSTPGAGGVAYGNLIQQLVGGSGGGGGLAGTGGSGGAGGGALELGAVGTLSVTGFGELFATGGGGEDGSTSGGGGGSGGALLLHAQTVDLSGILDVKGGDSGGGIYGGGGGGGGQIDVLYGSGGLDDSSATIILDGGTAIGLNRGESGSPGTYTVGTLASVPEPSALVMFATGFAIAMAVARRRST